MLVWILIALSFLQLALIAKQLSILDKFVSLIHYSIGVLRTWLVRNPICWLLLQLLCGFFDYLFSFLFVLVLAGGRPRLLALIIFLLI